MFKYFLGLSTIVLGIFIEIIWLGICFITVIVGLLVIKYKPELLVSPFFYFLDLGNSILYRNYYYRPRFSTFRYSRPKRFNYNRYSNRKINTKPQNKLHKYYKILESQETDSLDNIKSRYRKLIKKYHFDITASQNLLEDQKKYNKERTLALNEAYSEIKKART